MTVADKLSAELAPGTLNSVLKQAGLKKLRRPMEYLAIIEQGGTGYSAYVPDLRGCVAAADTRAEVQELIRGAIALHMKGMREDGLPAPSAHR